MSIGDNIRELRESHNLTQRDLGDILGVSDKAVSTWEKGRAIPRMGVIQKMADYFGVSKTSIIEDLSNTTPIASNLISVRPREIPILGTICAGNGIYAEENYQGSFALDKSISADYAIHVKGGSMTGAGIQDGDLAFIRKCDGDIVNGRIYAVILNGSNEATLKAVTAHEDFIVLTPLNPAYPVITTYSQEVYIAGELVGVYHPCL